MNTEPTPPIVEIPVADLLRVTPFKAHDDMRYYLDGVLVTPYQDHALLIATNGHWMAVYESPAAHVDKPRILALPKWFVNQVELLERGERLDEEDVEWDEDDGPPPTIEPHTLVVATETSHLTILQSGVVEQLVKPGLPFIDGKFPDWRKVLPDPAKLERGLYSPFAAEYFSALYRAVPDQREHPLFCYQCHDHSSPGIFRFGGMPGLILALMPRRDADKEIEGWPAWMTPGSLL